MIEQDSGKESKFDHGFGFGVFLTVVVVATVSLTSPDPNQEALDNCAKTHNVYQCEMVAVPKGN